MDDDKNIKQTDEPVAEAQPSETPSVVRPIAEDQPESGSSNSSDSRDSRDSRDASSSQEALDEESDRHLKEAIAEQAREDERPHSTSFTLGKILGGDILTAQMFRSNIWLIVLIVMFMVVYITNRYKVQKDLLEIDKLNTELDDAKYRALSSSSNLTEKSRESHVIETLQNSPDSDLKQSDRPPYIIDVPDK